MALIAALADQLPFAGALRRAVAAYALVNAVHILCLGLLIGSILPLDLGIAGMRGFGWAVAVARSLRRMAVAGFAGVALTGLYLFAVRPLDYLGNDAFLLKIAAIAVAGCNALTFSVVRHAGIRRFQAGASLTIWLTVLLAGRWIGFV
ncbi:DUF2214 domain-containing protein [Chelativorans alearense]|uniref:DUF2214 domain-containing protein n=1 Tax=Chelativorans alearense TaxID=2681495 RepID=UPI001969DFB6|nr:DUF2214 domain-containing protein [Chelativorans alearense]